MFAGYSRIRQNRYDFLVVCSYYKPYVSGLTNVAVTLSEKLILKGYRVAILCHNHDPALADFESLNGVHVYRAKPLLKLGRATFSANFFVKFMILAKAADRINLHLPLPEAGLLSFLSRKNIFTTYQCDAPRYSLKSYLVSVFLDFSSKITFLRSKKVFFSSQDYADFSRLARYASGKLFIIPPFCEKPLIGKPQYKLGDGIHYGFLGRFSTEKGLLLLIDAFQKYKDPNARLLLGGSTKLAGDNVLTDVERMIYSDPRIQLVLNMNETEKSNFLASIDVLCFPSLNSFEAFGIVQVEALYCKVPVLASDLPGVRTIVKDKHYGRIVKANSLNEWTQVISSPIPSRPSSKEVNELLLLYGVEAVFSAYRNEFFN
jgi:glycosyltransferase involved in cell wall biosynthesis